MTQGVKKSKPIEREMKGFRCDRREHENRKSVRGSVLRNRDERCRHIANGNFSAFRFSVRIDIGKEDNIIMIVKRSIYRTNLLSAI